MNKVARKMKLVKLRENIGPYPAKVRICRKEGEVEWYFRDDDNDGNYYITTRRVSDWGSYVTGSEELKRSFGCTVPTLLESFGWILPRKERFTSINILDATKKCLTCEVSWSYLVRRPDLPYGISTHPNFVFKMYKNRLPERIYMTTKKAKEWYYKLAGKPFISNSTLNKQQSKLRQQTLEQQRVMEQPAIVLQWTETAI